MKKILSMVMAVLLCGNVMALDNEPESGTSWQLLVGFNASGMKGAQMIDAQGHTQKFDGKIGVNLGFKFEYMLPNAKGTYINAGIDWTQKGARKKFIDTATDVNGDHGTPKVNHKWQAHYLELPIHAGYRYNINEKFGVYGEIGPYFAIGVTGKNRFKPTDDMYEDSHTMFFGKKFDDLNKKAIQRFDCGFGFRIGGEYNNQYSFNLAYDFGFTDIYTDKYRTEWKKNHLGASLPNLKNHNFTITFGYRF